MIHKLKVAVLRGGPSYEYEISMKSGMSILNNLTSEKYVTYDVVISRDGTWYLNGSAITPDQLLIRVDFVFSALHSGFGGGKIQKILHDFGIPYVGSDALSSAMSSNKYLSKKIYEKEGIKTPYHSLLRKDDFDEKNIVNIFRSIPMPAIVKPVDIGSSLGIYIVNSKQELLEAIENIFQISDSVLVEEFISGKKITCGVIDNFREKESYSLIPIEVVNDESIFNHESKRDGIFNDLTSQRLSQKEKEEIQDLSTKAHKALDLKHYSSSDFIVHPRRGVYLIETNHAPSLHEDSLMFKSLESVGIDLEDFINHLIDSAR